MIERGLKGVRPMAGGRRAGLVPTVSSMLPNAGCRRCMVVSCAACPPGRRRPTGNGRRGRIRANGTIRWLGREIRRRTRVVGGFPDGNGALMLICAGIRYVTANE